VAGDADVADGAEDDADVAENGVGGNHACHDNHYDDNKICDNSVCYNGPAVGDASVAWVVAADDVRDVVVAKEDAAG